MTLPTNSTLVRYAKSSIETRDAGKRRPRQTKNVFVADWNDVQKNRTPLEGHHRYQLELMPLEQSDWVLRKRKRSLHPSPSLSQSP
jgi:hypothetical protein